MPDVLLGIYLFVIGIWDYLEKKIPFFLLIPGIAAMLVHVIRNVCQGCHKGFGCQKGLGSEMLLSILLPVILGLLPGMILLLVAWSSKKIGYGDGIMILSLGGFLGYHKVIGILMCSLLIMSVGAIILLLFKKVKKESTLPYFPFLFLGFEVWCVAFGG